MTTPAAVSDRASYSSSSYHHFLSSVTLCQTAARLSAISAMQHAVAARLSHHPNGRQ